MSEIIENEVLSLPLLPLRGLNVFPGMLLTFDVERPASVAALGAAVKRSSLIFLSAQKDISIDAPGEEDIYRILLTGQADSVDTRSLYAALEGRFYQLDLRDRTTPKTDLWREAGENTLRGQFLSLMREKLAAASPEEQETFTRLLDRAIQNMGGQLFRPFSKEEP